jgi:CubicO group peptidase (beta-lactamase class C family)
MRRTAFVVLLTAIRPPEVGAQGLPQARAIEVGLDSSRLAAIAPMLREAVDRGEVAGVVTLVARHGRVAALDSAGFRNLERRTPAGAATLFRIASMSKPVTSVAALMLVEEGRLRLADPVARYIPAFANMMVAAPGDSGARRAALTPARRPITIHDLLTHRAASSTTVRRAMRIARPA